MNKLGESRQEKDLVRQVCQNVVMLLRGRAQQVVTVMPYKRILIGLVGLIFVVGLTIAGFVFTRDPAPELPPSHDLLLYIPDYPGAQQVKKVMAEKDEEDLDGPNDPYITVTFVTNDAPDEIFAFYKDALKRTVGDNLRQTAPIWWNVDSADEAIGNTLGALQISGSLPDTELELGFRFHVYTELQDGLTHVTVERRSIPGR